MQRRLGRLLCHNNKCATSGITRAARTSNHSRSYAVASGSKLEPRWAPIPNRAILSLTGPEPNLSTFLNGLLSTHVVPASDATQGFYSTFLSRHGRIFYDVFLHPHPYVTPSSNTGGYLLEYDPRPAPKLADVVHGAPPLLSLLKRFILRSKVKVADVSNEWNLYAAWGGQAEFNDDSRRANAFNEWRTAPSGAAEPTWKEGGIPDSRILDIQGEGVTGLWDRRSPGMGRRILVPNGEKPQLGDEYLFGASDDFILHRILHGVPEGAVDLHDALPMDRNVDLMGGVDFRKGCYVGQELTVRTYHTGTIRRRTVPVKLVPRSGNLSLSLLAGEVPIIGTLTPEGVKVMKKSTPHGKRTTTGPSSALTRGSKLLSRVGDHALAVVRLENLESFERGEVTLHISAKGKDGGGDVDQSNGWNVVPMRPSWWPVRSVDSGPAPQKQS